MKKHFEWPKFMEILFILVFLGFLAALTLPSISVTGKERGDCVANLIRIRHAKDQWALERHMKATSTPTEKEIFGPFIPVLYCPAGGTYSMEKVGENPTCSIRGHRLPK